MSKEQVMDACPNPQDEMHPAFYEGLWVRCNSWAPFTLLFALVI